MVGRCACEGEHAYLLGGHSEFVRLGHFCLPTVICRCRCRLRCRPQDAEEYFGHLLEVMARAERTAGDRLPGAAGAPTAALFKFGIEDRVQCCDTGRVSLPARPPARPPPACLVMHPPEPGPLLLSLLLALHRRWSTCWA